MRAALGVIVMLASAGCRPIVIQTGSPASPAPEPARPEPEPPPAPPPVPIAAQDVPEASEPASTPTSVALSEPEQPAPRPPPPPKGKPARHGKHNGKSGPDDGAESAVATPPPAAAAPAASPEPAPSDQRIVKRIEVHVNGSTVGVASRIDRVDPQDQHAYFAETADSGIVEPGMPCKVGERFDVKPKMPNYLSVDLQPCAAKVVFNVPIAQAVYLLSQMGDDAMKQANPALAQSYYATAARLLRKDDSKAADVALQKANEAAAQALGAPSKGKKLSRSALDALRDYQDRSNLPVTGELDDLTRHRLSGVDALEVMKRANAALKAKAPDGEKKVESGEREKRMRLELGPARAAPESAEVPKSPEGAVRERPRRELAPGVRPRLAP